ncbi:MAG: patatin-like phospholipase family protein [Nitrososphaerota archaeon]
MQKSENVLVLQGGGSLGAFACGAMKAFAKKNIMFDIISGTSIGAINAAIIAGSRSDNPYKALEEFWLELAESSVRLIPDFYTLDFDQEKKVLQIVQSPSASINSAIFGVPKFFVPRWLQWNVQTGLDIGKSQFPSNWTYLYDNTPLGKTIEKYIDFKKLSPRSVYPDEDNDPGTIRLIVTSANVLTAEPIVFDSGKIQIKIKHLLASTGYPQYGFPWVEAEDKVFGWDGALLSNSPIKEVLEASPRMDKHIFMVENYPRKIDRLPANMTEVQSRAKDIMFCDKTSSLIKLSKLINKQVDLMEKLYEALQRCDNSNLTKAEMEEIEKSYELLVRKYGAKILSVTRIVRKSPSRPYSQQNADFSPDTIKQIINEGEANGIEELKSFRFKYI